MRPNEGSQRVLFPAHRPVHWALTADLSCNGGGSSGLRGNMAAAGREALDEELVN